jgi:hypothetical protein
MRSPVGRSLKTPPHRQTSLTLIACLNRLSNVVQFVKLMSGSQPHAGGELHPRRPDCTAPPADTRRVLCLHVLSSFQRTGVVLARRLARQRRVVGAFPLRVFPRWGNLPILLEDSDFCQPLAALLSPADATSHPVMRSPTNGLGIGEPLKEFAGTANLAGSRSVQRIYAAHSGVSTPVFPCGLRQSQQLGVPAT